MGQGRIGKLISSNHLGNLNDTIDHELELTNLQPDTKYFYQIGDTSEILMAATSELYFHTPPNAGTDKPSTIWVLGDCGTANEFARSVRDAYYDYIDNEHTVLILFLGDNAYDDKGHGNDENTLLDDSRGENKVEKR